MPLKSRKRPPVRFVQVAAEPVVPASALLVRLPDCSSMEVVDELQAVLVAQIVQSLA